MNKAHPIIAAIMILSLTPPILAVRHNLKVIGAVHADGRLVEALHLFASDIESGAYQMEAIANKIESFAVSEGNIYAGAKKAEKANWAFIVCFILSAIAQFLLLGRLMRIYQKS